MKWKKNTVNPAEQPALEKLVFDLEEEKLA
jgi:hypothetical protein